MRTYLIDSDQNEYSFELVRTEKHSDHLIEMDFVCDGELQRFFYRRLTNKLFVSKDRVSWKPISAGGFEKTLLDRALSFKVYRGFKPSGLNSGAQGELLTQMPGKVVKISVKEDQEVKQGDTVLILEAMKMENEIKAPIDGVVKTIHVQEGQALETGVLMLEIE